jgi:2-C-methyl-D-erythritol 2,4-cyclodiphosphate synthase
MMEKRWAVGIGYDVHRLEAGRRLVLGGVEIPHPRGLAGHSDADVVIHAVMDALLGAAGLPDIGVHFPPSDPAYKDASSLNLLAKVVVMLGDGGWHVGNIDITVLAEEPRLASHRSAMMSNIAAAIGDDDAAVNIKATTHEGLGALGRGEGIAAMAVAMLWRETAS